MKLLPPGGVAVTPAVGGGAGDEGSSGGDGPRDLWGAEDGDTSIMAIFAHPLEKFRACLPPEALEPPGSDAGVVDGVLRVAMAEVILD